MSSFNPGKAISRAFTMPGLPAIPEIKIPPPPDIVFPEPTEPPNAPLSPSMTAAAQRARLRPGRAAGAGRMVLTTPSQRGRDDSDVVTRPTLLGR